MGFYSLTKGLLCKLIFFPSPRPRFKFRNNWERVDRGKSSGKEFYLRYCEICFRTNQKNCYCLKINPVLSEASIETHFLIRRNPSSD